MVVEKFIILFHFFFLLQDLDGEFRDVYDVFWRLLHLPSRWKDYQLNLTWLLLSNAIMTLYIFFGFIINEVFYRFLLLSHCLLLLHLDLIKYTLFFLLLSDIPEGKFEFVIDFEDLVDIARGLRALRGQVIRLN